MIDTAVDSPVIGQAQAILNQADNYGGRISFRYLPILGCILIVVFGILYIRDRMAGGYKAEKLTSEGGH